MTYILIIVSKIRITIRSSGSAVLGSACLEGLLLAGASHVLAADFELIGQLQPQQALPVHLQGAIILVGARSATLRRFVGTVRRERVCRRRRQ